MSLTTIGLEFVVVGCLPIFGGYWCDVWLHSTPWLTVAGVAVGLAAAMYNLIRRVQAVVQREKKLDESNRKT